MGWLDKLTKGELKHLRESNIRSKIGIKRQMEFMKRRIEETKERHGEEAANGVLYPCRECRHIYLKLFGND